MDEATQKKLTNLKKAFDSGIWSEDEYKELVIQLAGETYWAEISGTDNTVVQAGGNAAVAKDNSVAITGDVHGDVNINTDLSQPSPADLQTTYLELLIRHCNKLSLDGIDPKAAADDSERLELSAVYTALLTYTSRRDDNKEPHTMMREEGQEPKPLSALEQLNQHKKLVILGDPGSGKSSFVNYVTTCLAGERLGFKQNIQTLTTPLHTEADEEPQPQPWEHGPLLPLRIILRDLAARGLPAAHQEANADHFWKFVEGELERQSLAEYAPHLKKHLDKEGGLILFDGLDEVPTADDHRLHIKQLVQSVADRFPKCRLLVTSRTYAYQEQNWRLPSFQAAVLAPFTLHQIEHFVTRWYRYIAVVRDWQAEEATGRAVLLNEAIKHNPRLQNLAVQPLLLTLMASLHAWRGGSLPERREELYDDSVELLLHNWEKQRLTRDEKGNTIAREPSLAQWLKIDQKQVRGVLEQLAFEVHSAQEGLVGTADIDERDLVMALLNLSSDKNLAYAHLVDYLRDRAGILLARGNGIYTFPHRTFQEYLAAVHLTNDEFPQKVAELACTDPNRWREVALLAGAKAGRGTEFALWSLVNELCPIVPQKDDPPADHWGALLAGQLIIETTDLTKTSRAQTAHVARVRNGLVNVLTGSQIPAIERALAGRHLARLGDPRPEVLTVDEMQFCWVPAGLFWMGSSDDDPLADDNEKPQHQLDIPYDYYMGRYPVTNAQYSLFVEDNGYANEQWWKVAIQAGYWKNGRYRNRTKPTDFGTRFNDDNQPVVGVSWDEALAFCRWLTARWHQSGLLPEDWQVMLPSEAEWEKAARGGFKMPNQPAVLTVDNLPIQNPQSKMSLDATLRPQNPLPQRIYPWGNDELTAEQANYKESEIEATSAVGGYTAAQSVYGCKEMSGNVFEWTGSLRKNYPYLPDDGRERLERGSLDWTAMRGGSWASGAKWGRCGARDWLNPYHFNGLDRGFRVLLSPF